MTNYILVGTTTLQPSELLLLKGTVASEVIDMETKLEEKVGSVMFLHVEGMSYLGSFSLTAT